MAFWKSPRFSGVTSEEIRLLPPLLDLYFGSGVLFVFGLLALNFKTVYLELNGEESDP